MNYINILYKLTFEVKSFYILMLDVNNERYIPTPYQIDRKDEEFEEF
jgi:hypothetical protein